mmetsp:Transcript_18577/g.57090  ORF Transcript_18577/g.57090 Transcript_18577/m.57090 type:complete len:308 (+) Transcript_18577:1790-2713(+)
MGSSSSRERRPARWRADSPRWKVRRGSRPCWRTRARRTASWRCSTARCKRPSSWWKRSDRSSSTTAATSPATTASTARARRTVSSANLRRTRPSHGGEFSAWKRSASSPRLTSPASSGNAPRSRSDCTNRHRPSSSVFRFWCVGRPLVARLSTEPVRRRTVRVRSAPKPVDSPARVAERSISAYSAARCERLRPRKTRATSFPEASSHANNALSSPSGSAWSGGRTSTGGSAGSGGSADRLLRGGASELCRALGGAYRAGPRAGPSRMRRTRRIDPSGRTEPPSSRVVVAISLSPRRATRARSRRSP